MFNDCELLATAINFALQLMGLVLAIHGYRDPQGGVAIAAKIVTAAVAVLAVSFTLVLLHHVLLPRRRSPFGARLEDENPLVEGLPVPVPYFVFASLVIRPERLIGSASV